MVIEVLVNAIPPGYFMPTNKKLARDRLKLPNTGTLIGTAGSLYRNRGIKYLYNVFLKLCDEREDLYLVLAGRMEKSAKPPTHDRVIYLGNIDYSIMPILFNALDVGVICNLNNSFGKYCFPQKLYEMLSCRLPVVVADVGDMSRLLKGYEACLYSCEDAVSLENCIIKQIQFGVCPEIPVPEWGALAKKLAGILSRTNMPKS